MRYAGLRQHVAVEASETAVAANVVQDPVAAQSVVDDADRASTVRDEAAGQLVGPSAVGVDR
jgi:hypothetical protein